MSDIQISDYAVLFVEQHQEKSIEQLLLLSDTVLSNYSLVSKLKMFVFRKRILHLEEMTQSAWKELMPTRLIGYVDGILGSTFVNMYCLGRFPSKLAQTCVSLSLQGDFIDNSLVAPCRVLPLTSLCFLLLTFFQGFFWFSCPIWGLCCILILSTIYSLWIWLLDCIFSCARGTVSSHRGGPGLFSIFG